MPPWAPASLAIRRVKWTPRNGNARVGHRVEEVLHEVRARGREHPVLAAEREDRDARVEPRHAGDAVALEPRAGHEDAAVDVAGRRRDDDGGVAAPDSHHARPRPHLATSPHELARHRAGHLAVVDDPRLRDEERSLRRGVRLALAKLAGVDAAHAREAVGPPPPLELVEPRDLVGARGDDDLAAPLEPHAVLLAEALEHPAPAGAEARLE